MVAEHPEIYYGLTVTNYESQNGQKDWKIFYSDWNENPDDAHIFLITGDYVDVSTEDKLDNNTKMKAYNNSKYATEWYSKPSMQTVSNEVIKRFKVEYALNKSNISSTCVSTLLNHNNWKKYTDNGIKADYAIGGSTIEIWVASWNNLYKENKLYFTSTGNNGYTIENVEKPTTTTFSNKDNEGYNNKLYYPHKSDITDGECNVGEYWLASPTAVNSAYLLDINCEEDICWSL